MPDLSALSATELPSLYGSGALSPIEVARDALTRIEHHEHQVNAFVVRDPERALAEAARSEARWREKRPLGPLDGVPVTIKDNIAVGGWPMRRGSSLASDAPFPEDAPATARLREAGAVILGKTTMPEYGWKGVGDSPLTGITRNPWNLATGPGGSSAGAAVAAALNLGCLHIGTDGAGSVRIPAAFTGVVGFKPTYGRVPAWPLSTMGFLAHIGPLTRTVADASLAFAAIGQPDARDMTAVLARPGGMERLTENGLRGLRVAWSPRLGFEVAVDPEVAQLTERAARAFEALGATVEEADPGFPDPVDLLDAIWSAGAALALRDIGPEERGHMDPGLVAVAERGAGVSGMAYVDALLYRRGELARAMARFHERYDLLLTPTLPIPAFEVGRNTPAHGRYGADWTAWTPFTYPFNLTQQPAISVPCGLTQAGLPVGLQIVGPFGHDEQVLAAAAAYEAAHPFAAIAAPRGEV
ncbi:MAG TPA: amidase [Beijerinckiaceae bacterium]|jgi:aspartyl-tRNA(Asn)/glutamyl-tRNA(Gln) amidotransferase subunit A